MSKSILVANRDLITLEAIRQAVRSNNNVICSQAGHAALEIAEEHELDLAIVDVELIDMTGLELLRALGLNEKRLPCLFISRFGHDAANAEAIRLGATCCIEQPLTIEVLLRSVREAYYGRAVNTAVSEHYSLNRWADIVVRVVELPHDVRTLEEWGRSVGVSVGALRNWCRTANIPARRSLLFARLLRAVVQHKMCPIPPAELLNVVDRRTLVKMLLDAGGTSTELPTNETEFFERQRYVNSREALKMLNAKLAAGSRTDANYIRNRRLTEDMHR